MRRQARRRGVVRVNAGQVGFYVARKKGYYAEEGLDVIFKHSFSTLGKISHFSANQKSYQNGPDGARRNKGRMSHVS